jgi:hypothetical protein
LRAVSSGEFSPRVGNDSEEGRAKNRRIEIRLLPLGDAADFVAIEEPAASDAAPAAVALGDLAAAPPTE